MKRLAIVVLSSCLLASASYAGDPKPVTSAKSKALLFDLGGLATLAAGNYGGGLGFKYYIASDLALRLSLGFTSSTQTDKNTQNPIPAGRLGESNLTNTQFTVAPAITYNLAKSSTIAAYVGGMVSFTSTSEKREGNSGGTGAGFDSGEEYHVSSTGYGVAGLLGAEWFPWENISLSAEYRLGYYHSSSTTESTAAGTTTSFDGPTTSGFGLGSANSSAFTLSFYF
jgi:opacity protein-like surface antigen